MFAYICPHFTVDPIPDAGAPWIGAHDNNAIESCQDITATYQGLATSGETCWERMSAIVQDAGYLCFVSSVPLCILYFDLGKLCFIGIEVDMNTHRVPT